MKNLLIKKEYNYGFQQKPQNDYKSNSLIFKIKNSFFEIVIFVVEFNLMSKAK